MIIFGFTSIVLVNRLNINIVFSRLTEIEEVNKNAGGVTFRRIVKGSAFNREEAFKVAGERYRSKESWIIGYGWGLEKNNRDAFYTNPKIPRLSTHSQIFAILFLFGWIGFFSYFAMILRIIYKSYKTSVNKSLDYIIRLMAFFFLISFCLFTFNEIKVDSIYSPSYFAVTIIWMGLAFATNNTIYQPVIEHLKQ